LFKFVSKSLQLCSNIVHKNSYYASQGYFVVAAWNSGSAEMGHVDTILPGHTGTSWKDIYVMDTGINEYANCQYAKDFGPFLIGYGFQEITITWDYSEVPTPQQYTPQIGDTRVWQPYPGQSTQAGHIDWWNGEKWVSDYRQNNKWWPGEGYRINHPPYKIYR
jgi:hypothetical protein